MTKRVYVFAHNDETEVGFFIDGDGAHETMIKLVSRSNVLTHDEDTYRAWPGFYDMSRDPSDSDDSDYWCDHAYYVGDDDTAAVTIARLARECGATLTELGA